MIKYRFMLLSSLSCPAIGHAHTAAGPDLAHLLEHLLPLLLLGLTIALPIRLLSRARQQPTTRTD